MSGAKESRVLAGLGVGFVGLAGFFLWRDLSLPRELILLVATVVAGVAAVARQPRAWPALGPAALLAVVLAGGAWYLAQRGAGLLPALAVGLVLALAAVVRVERLNEPPGGLPQRLTWYGFGTALLASSSAFYFHYLTTGVAADSVGRRLIPTLVWLVVGLAIFIAGRVRSAAAAHVGVGLLVVAVGKALLYDTVNLHGGLRVLLLSAVGAMLLFGAQVVRRTSTAERS